MRMYRLVRWYINGLVQDCSISSELAMEILQSYIMPSINDIVVQKQPTIYTKQKWFYSPKTHKFDQRLVKFDKSDSLENSKLMASCALMEEYDAASNLVCSQWQHSLQMQAMLSLAKRLWWVSNHFTKTGTRWPDNPHVRAVPQALWCPWKANPISSKIMGQSDLVAPRATSPDGQDKLGGPLGQRQYLFMMTSYHGEAFYITDPLWGESTSHRWIPTLKASIDIWEPHQGTPNRDLNNDNTNEIIWKYLNQAEDSLKP